MPTIPATQILQDLQSDAARSFRTGISQLDSVLASRANGTSILPGVTDGLHRGSLLEVWGSSGSGKTTMAVQIAAEALVQGETVVWIACGRGFVHPRLTKILGNKTAEPIESIIRRFRFVQIQTLSQLLVLLMHTPSSIELSNAGLIVLDDLHYPLDVSHPRTAAPPTSPAGSDAAKWVTQRRQAVLGAISSALRRLGSTRHITSIVTCNSTTRSRGEVGSGAVLVPAIGGADWERGVDVRAALFRDFARSRHQQGRFVGVTKLAGQSMVDYDGDVGLVVDFSIDQNGLVDLAAENDHITKQHGSSLPARLASPIKSSRLKRKYDQVDDSEEELLSEYEWDEGGAIAAEGLVDDDAVDLPEQEVTR